MATKSPPLKNVLARQLREPLPLFLPVFGLISEIAPALARGISI